MNQLKRYREYICFLEIILVLLIWYQWKITIYSDISWCKMRCCTLFLTPFCYKSRSKIETWQIPLFLKLRAGIERWMREWGQIHFLTMFIRLKKTPFPYLVMWIMCVFEQLERLHDNWTTRGSLQAREEKD